MYNEGLVRRLRDIYSAKKDKIERRLQDFRDVFNGSEEDVLAELAYCLCTAQSKALYADEAVKMMCSSRALFEGSADDVFECMKRVRFAPTKSKRIVEARDLFKREGGLKSRLLSFSDDFERRIRFADIVKGLGMKESSHFLRNVGFGARLAILDRHVFRKMIALGALDSLPKSITRKKYLEIEQTLTRFAEYINIPLEALDFVLLQNEISGSKDNDDVLWK